MLNKISTYGIRFFLFFSMTLCALTLTTAGTKAATKLSKTTVRLNPGENEKIAFSGSSISGGKSKIVKWSNISKKKPKDKNIYWAAKSKAKATIKKKGKKAIIITAAKAGKTTLKVRYKGVNHKCSIVVENPGTGQSVTDIGATCQTTVSFTGSTSLKTSQIVDYKSLYIYANVPGKIYWGIENPELAKIEISAENTIRITGIKYGTTRLRAYYLGNVYDTIVNITYPKYWKSELKKSIEAYKNHDSSGKLPSYVYVTDTHWNSSAKVSPTLISYLKNTLNISTTIFGGDAISTHCNTQNEAMAELEDFYSQMTGNVFSTTGNHDWNSQSNTIVESYLSGSQLYNIMYKREESFAVTENSAQHGYIDDKKNKIRYISFEYDATNPFDPSVRVWLDEKFSELDDDWHVILFSHAFFNASAYGTNMNISQTAKELGEHLLDLENEYPADIACWFVGHIHRDLSTVLYKKNAAFPVVSTNCDVYAYSTMWGGEKMKKGTDTEQAFDLVQIDKDKRTIYTTRVGAGYDRIINY